MRNRGLTTRHIAATALTVLLLTGCAQTRDFLTGSSRSDSSDGDVGILGAPEAEHYLAELQRLASGDPATQAEIFADAQSGSQLTPGSQTNLRFALVLATPGHSEFDPDLAASLLREVLARTELLTQAEIALATIHLKSAEQIAVAQAEVQRLRSATSRAAQSRESVTNQRLAAAEAENRRLRRELDEAEKKLEAITSIERSIREQE
jgi:hypothetical protein